MSGEEPGYTPPDHKTTAEFRVPGRPAEPAPAAEPARPDATVVDEPVDDLIDPGVTSQDVVQEDAGPDVAHSAPPADDPEPDDVPDDADGPGELAGTTLQDVPADDQDDPNDADDPEDHASVTVSDIRVPPKVMAFEMPAQEASPPGQEGVAADPATVPEEIPAAERAAVPHEQAPGPRAAGPVAGEAPWTEQFGAEAESANPGGASPDPAQAYTPPPAEATVPPPYEATAPAMAHAAPPSGGVPPSGTSEPSRSGRSLLLAALIGAVVLLAVAAVVMLLLDRGSETEGKASTTPSPAASSPAATSPATPGGPGGPSPSGAPVPPGGVPGQPPASQAPAAPPRPIGPVLDGEGITYRLVQQSEGYFEGRLVITNRTDRPMRTWRLTFRVPGAVVKNIWGARLVRGGESAEITNLDGAPAIPPGGTWDVQFGAAGATSTPKGCRLNGDPCGF